MDEDNNWGMSVEELERAYQASLERCQPKAICISDNNTCKEEHSQFIFDLFSESNLTRQKATARASKLLWFCMWRNGAEIQAINLTMAQL